jgi:hypothetical protein
MNWKFWSKRKYKYRFITKGGASFTFSCENLDLEWRDEDMQITEWKAQNAKGEVPRHLSPLEIAAVIRLN